MLGRKLGCFGLLLLVIIALGLSYLTADQWAGLDSTAAGAKALHDCGELTGPTSSLPLAHCHFFPGDWDLF